MVGVGGCWAQSVKDEVFERFPFVDVAFGPGQIHRLADFLTQDSLTAQGYFEFEGFSGDLPAKREREFQGWVQISVGCNCACAYCIVPQTRGREVSRAPGELIAEIEAARLRWRARGDPAGPEREQLRARSASGGAHHVRRAAWLASTRSPGIERIRYTSPHPKDMREDVIRAHAELPALCAHIHLPLQSGSSRILKAMRRTYNRERYLDRVAQIREHVPDCALTTDIIVGFPGETEEDFGETLEVVDAGRLRRRLHLRLLAAARHGGGRRCPTRSRTRSSASGWSGSSRSSRGVPASEPSASSGARWRSWSRGPAGPTRPGCGAGSATTRPSTSRAPPNAGELVEVEIAEATSTTLSGHQRLLSSASAALAASPWTCWRSSARRGSERRRSRSRSPSAAARARRGAGGDLLRRDPGLPRARDAERRRDARGTRAARASAGRLRRAERGVQRRPVRGPGARGDRPAARRGAPPDRRRRNRPVPAGGAGRPRAAAASARRRARTRSSERSPIVARRRCTASSTRTRPQRSTRATASASHGRSSFSARASTPRATASSSGRRACATRRPLVGLVIDREELGTRIDARVDEMVAARRTGRGARGRGCRGLAHRPGSARLRRAPGGRHRGASSAPTAPTPAASSPGCGRCPGSS